MTFTGGRRIGGGKNERKIILKNKIQEVAVKSYEMCEVWNIILLSVSSQTQPANQ